MGFIRTAVVLGAVVALMPTDKAQQLHMAEQAAAAAHWTLTFCERNTNTCAQAGEAWGVFVKKAQFAGQLVVDLINDTRKSEPAPPVEPAAVRVESQPPSVVRRGTLTPQDLKPGWRGGQARASL